MKKVISIFSVLIGCLIIAISINLILIPNQMITFGIDGIGCLLNYISDINPAFNMLFINLIIILIASIFLKLLSF